jgi:hypothetical protein
VGDNYDVIVAGGAAVTEQPFGPDGLVLGSG